MQADTTTMMWFDPSSDSAYRRILRAAMRDARRDRPDVMKTPDLAPCGFDEVVFLTAERAENMRIAAYAAVGPLVEEAVTLASLAHQGPLLKAGLLVPELQTSRTSRAAAAAVASIHRMREVREKVVTASEIHKANVESLRRYGLRALSNLDQAVRANHRFAQHLTYVVPTEIQFSEAIYEIGLARVLAAQIDAIAPTDTVAENDQEDVA